MSAVIREDLLDKLRTLAERRHRTIDELLEDWLATQLPDADDESNVDAIPPNSLAALARSAEEANLRGTGRVTARNSREVLDNELLP